MRSQCHHLSLHSLDNDNHNETDADELIILSLLGVFSFGGPMRKCLYLVARREDVDRMIAEERHCGCQSIQCGNMYRSIEQVRRETKKSSTNNQKHQRRSVKDLSRIDKRTEWRRENGWRRILFFSFGFCKSSSNDLNGASLFHFVSFRNFSSGNWIYFAALVSRPSNLFRFSESKWSFENNRSLADRSMNNDTKKKISLQSERRS